MTEQHDDNQMTDKQIKDLMERSPVFEELWDTYVFSLSGSDFAEGVDLHQIKDHPGFQVFLAGACHLEEAQSAPVEHLATMATIFRGEMDALSEPTSVRSEWALEYLHDDEVLTDLEFGAVMLAARRESPESLVSEELDRRRTEMNAPDLFGLGTRNEMPPMVALSMQIEQAMNPELGMVTSPVFGTAWYQYLDELPERVFTLTRKDPGVRVFNAGVGAVAAKDQAERKAHLDTMLEAVRDEVGALKKAGEEPVNLRSQRAVFLLHRNGHLTNEEAAALSPDVE